MIHGDDVTAATYLFAYLTAVSKSVSFFLWSLVVVVAIAEVVVVVIVVVVVVMGEGRASVPTS